MRPTRIEDVFEVAARGETMPQKSTYFYPKLVSGPALPPPRRVKPWLELCRAAVGDLRVVLDGMPTRNEREPVVGAGKGGDDTTAVDAAAEAAILTRLERLHADEGIDFHLVSEELGERTFGLSPTTRVVVDPIDGSLNAKRNIPFFSVSIAVAEGLDDEGRRLRLRPRLRDAARSGPRPEARARG